MGSARKRILMVVANPSVSTTTGWPVGFWASELTHAYDAFVKKGYEVVVASPDGGKVELDALSDPRDASGYSKDDTLSLAYLAKPGFSALLERTPSVRDLKAADFDAIVVAGGQSPMFTFQGAAGLQELFTQFHRAGKVSAALCHGVSLLLWLKAEDGRPFVAGRRITGFANSEEDYADKAVGRKLMPFRIEDEARKLGAAFVAAPAFQPHAVRDGNLVTGQQQHSGAETARLVIEALEQQGRGDTVGTDALAVINTRRSTRKFTPDPVGEEDVRDLLEAAMNAPSAVNEQAWQFVVLSGTVLEDYLKINANTPKGAPVAILVCQDLAAEKAKGYSVQDCAAATQNILLAAHARGLGAVWTTVFPHNAEKVRGLLGIPENVVPFSCIPLGRPAGPAPRTGSRFDETKAHRQAWGGR